MRITLDISEDEFYERLKGLFREEYHETMPHVLRAMIGESEHWRSIVMKASMNILPEYKYKPGDVVKIQEGSLASWRHNKVAMQEEGLIDVKGFIKCQIVNLNQFEPEPYHVNYEIINDKGEKVKEDYSVTQLSIKGYYEVYPGDKES